MVEGATIFAQNAKAGGVNVTVKNVDGGTIYGDQYLKWPFSADYWGTRNYLLQAATGVLKTAAVQRDALGRVLGLQEVRVAVPTGARHRRREEARRRSSRTCSAWSTTTAVSSSGASRA